MEALLPAVPTGAGGEVLGWTALALRNVPLDWFVALDQGGQAIELASRVVCIMWG